MPDIEVNIGGRSFTVNCQAGEESYLEAAAKLLDEQAQPLMEALGRLTEARMLLMAGLMLADKTVAQEAELSELRAKVKELEGRPEPQPREIEVTVIPPEVPKTLAEIARRSEALADGLEARLTGAPAAPPSMLTLS